jgi:drug/metabolite transporter (DMT)-like permease
VGVLFALAASASWGVGDFLGGLSSRARSAIAVMAVSQPVGFLALGIAMLARWQAPPGAAVAWACPAALLGTIGLAAFYRGMATGSISIVAPIAGAAAVVPVTVGLARGDRPSALQGVGFACAIVGVAGTSWEGRGRRIAEGVAPAVVALLGFGGYFVLLNRAGREDFLWAAFLFRCTSTTLVWVAVLALRPPLRDVRRSLPVLAAVGLLDTGGNTLYAAASGHGLVSVTSVLASLYPVVTILLAHAYLRERLRTWQYAGIASTLAGAALISVG